jgi:2-polyprenyl-3-methyl-5-hydroxy-6-metoxy-1,4-benzoquinol methylase
MSDPQSTYFDQAAAAWDDNPVRVALLRAVAEAIFRQVQPTSYMDVLDYGCGTGLVSFFLAPHVATVTAADSSEGMLTVLRQKIDQSGLHAIRAIRLDLERDAVPDARYDLIVTNMVMHHVADTESLLRNFHALLWPGGVLCVSDLDTEPGVFHDPEAAATVHHHGFDRREFRGLLEQAGFHDIQDTTAHTIRKPAAGGGERDFPVFLMTGRH